MDAYVQCCIHIILHCQKAWSEEGMRWVYQPMILFYLTQRNIYAVSSPFLSGGQDWLGMFMNEKKSDTNKLATVQWRTIKMLRGLEHMPYEKGEGTWHSAWRKGGFGGDPTAIFQYFQSSCEEVITMTAPGSSHWRVVEGQKMMAVKLKQESFRPDIRNFHTMRTLKQWNRFPRKAVPSPPLAIFKTQMDEVLHNFVWPHSWPCFEQELRLDILLMSIPTWIILWYSVQGITKHLIEATHCLIFQGLGSNL